ncbi:MAG: radical SAM protein [bacterium]|nr:radical SAM protein [bacterium]
MDFKKIKCILNPEYRLRTDRKRVLLFYRIAEPPLTSEISDIVGFIHPLTAVLLSLFDGEKSVKTVATDFSYLTGLDKSDILTLISQLFENKTKIKVNFNNEFFVFPKNTLVGYKENLRFPRYNPEDFLLSGNQLDFSSTRLYRPLDAFFFLNNLCVTHCAYCYADKREQWKCRIPFPRLKEIFAEARTLGMRSINISGGELFTYKHWRELLRELVGNGFNPYISTKYPLNRRRIEELKDTGITRIQLSIDTVVNEEMVQLLGTDERYLGLIRETLKELDRQGFDIRISSQVTSVNENSMDKLLDYLLRFENIKLISLRPTGYAMYQKEGKYLSIRPSKIGSVKIEEHLRQLNEIHGERVKLEFFQFPERGHYCNPSKEWKQTHYDIRAQCSGNFHGFTILPDGKVTVCEELYYHPRFIIGDLMKQSIMEVWNSEQALEIYNISADCFRKESACKTCDDFRDCHHKKGACWKQVMYAYGEDNWDYPDPRCPHAPEPFNTFWID